MPITYSGALHSKKKAELQDIALALRISDDGTREDLSQRIRKYLDDHPNLEDSPKFAGLYGRKKRSAPPSSLGPPKASRTASRTMPSLPETPERSAVVPEIAPTPSSLPPLPPSEPSLSVVQRITAVIPPTTVAKVKNAITTRYEAAKVSENGTELLQSSRGFLSNSMNIWSLTAILDLSLILYHIIPWKYAQLSYSPSESFPSPFADYTVPYPPSSIFQAPAFWSVLFHWSLPSLVIPSMFGFLISFTPTSSANSLPFDPLTASIIRLAAQIAWTFPSPRAFNDLEIVTHNLYGLDVLGLQWRVLTASLAVMFAFAEQISKAPSFPATHAPTLNPQTALQSITAPTGVDNDDLASEID